MKESPNYYAIVTADVRYDKDLTPNAKLLFGEITALCTKEGYCWATNEYFAELYGTSEKTITRWVKNLEEKGYISTTIKTFRYADGTVKKIRYICLDKNVRDRVDKIVFDHTDKNVQNHTDKNVPYNNTIRNNTIRNTTIRKERVSASRFARPSLEEVRAYCEERKNKIDPEHFIDYYEANGWKVGKSSMKDWKAAVRNWERKSGQFPEKNNKGIRTKSGQDVDPEYLDYLDSIVYKGE